MSKILIINNALVIECVQRIIIIMEYSSTITLLFLKFPIFLCIFPGLVLVIDECKKQCVRRTPCCFLTCSLYVVCICSAWPLLMILGVVKEVGIRYKVVYSNRKLRRPFIETDHHCNITTVDSPFFFFFYYLSRLHLGQFV